MPNFVDLTGKTFSRLTVTGQAPKINNRIKWHCKCVCGGSTITDSNGLLSGHTKSCGCLQREKAAITGKNSKTHGMRYSVEYQTWVDIKRRCNDPKRESFKHYGARGITVCDRWLHSFENFFEDMGKRPDTKSSIERIDNDGPYSPDNCKWATITEQNRNKTGCIKITHNGVTKTASEWSIDIGGSRNIISQRLKRGWSVKKALTTPPMIKHK